MTTIDAASRLAEVIRQQIGGSGEAAMLRRKAAEHRKTDAERASGRASSADDLPTVVMRRVAALSPDDPQRSRKAFRIFLETMLLAELGGDLINDPAFYDLVGKVQEQMEARPELAAAIDRASQALLAATPAKQRGGA